MMIDESASSALPENEAIASFSSLPEDTLHLIFEALAANPASFERLASCSRRLSHAAAATRELCVERHFETIAADVYAVVGDPLRHCTLELGASTERSWVQGVSWTERLRLLSIERALLNRAGVARLWARLEVPLLHLLRIRVAERLVHSPTTAMGPRSLPFAEMHAEIDKHLRTCAAHGIASEKLAFQLARIRPMEASDLALALTLLLACCGSLPRHPSVADFLSSAVSLYDVEEAYVSLLTTQRPLLSVALFQHYEQEFATSFGLEPTH
ncbi:hypothetical protein T492DRAFT_1034204 [Pavlovales sp. CCMP2436]|nr:hypothetical protein T492DRAFT_1034204 [Pavlovales sp. CCMP2436]